MRARTSTRSHGADAPKSIADIRAFGYNAEPTEAIEAGLPLPRTFYVIGAPRCGTTSLSATLKRNPHISFSVPKETHFLQRDRGEQTADAWRRTYVERYHPRLDRQHQALGDGSVSYLYSPEAIRRALEFDPHARFIAVLRNPAEMLQSFHLRLLYLLDEDVTDFATAWSLQESRAEGRNIPRHCRDPRMLQYGQVGRFSEHLQRVFAVAGRDRCLVLLLEDLVQDPRAAYEQVLDFIGVDDDGQTRIRHKRQSLGYRSRWLQRLLMNPPDWVLRHVQTMSIKQIPRLKRWRKKMKRVNNKEAESPRLASATQAMLREYFAPDITRLAALLERDLSHWLDARAR